MFGDAWTSGVNCSAELPLGSVVIAVPSAAALLLAETVKVSPDGAGSSTPASFVVWMGIV
jgi:hypothetical protein